MREPVVSTSQEYLILFGVLDCYFLQPLARRFLDSHIFMGSGVSCCDFNREVFMLKGKRLPEKLSCKDRTAPFGINLWKPKALLHTSEIRWGNLFSFSEFCGFIFVNEQKLHGVQSFWSSLVHYKIPRIAIHHSAREKEYEARP